MDHRVHGRLHNLSSAPRNPFRNEADAFRVLMMVVAAGAIVVAVTLAAGTTAGVILAAVFVGIGLWLTAGWLRYWLGTRDDQE